MTNLALEGISGERLTYRLTHQQVAAAAEARAAVPFEGETLPTLAEAAEGTVLKPHPSCLSLKLRASLFAD
jgi:hypothetical protein